MKKIPIYITKKGIQLFVFIADSFKVSSSFQHSEYSDNFWCESSDSEIGDILQELLLLNTDKDLVTMLDITSNM